MTTSRDNSANISLLSSIIIVVYPPTGRKLVFINRRTRGDTTSTTPVTISKPSDIFHVRVQSKCDGTIARASYDLQSGLRSEVDDDDDGCCRILQDDSYSISAWRLRNVRVTMSTSVNVLSWGCGLAARGCDARTTTTSDWLTCSCSDDEDIIQTLLNVLRSRYHHNTRNYRRGTSTCLQEGSGRRKKKKKEEATMFFFFFFFVLFKHQVATI